MMKRATDGRSDFREQVRPETTPQTAQANRQISARLNCRRQKNDQETFRSPHASVAEMGTMPAAFDPSVIAENIDREALAGTRPARRESALTEEAPDVRLAENAWEHLQAFHLLYRQYLSFGYMGETAAQVRISSHNLSSNSHTFVAVKNGRVIGTVTCLEDGAAGLPADAYYPRELEQLRARRNKLVEVGAFAVENEETNTASVMALIQTITAFCRNTLGASDWVITVHPRHIRFYQKVMLFELVGENKTCGAVNEAPAVLMRLDLETMPARFAERYARHGGRRNLHRYFFGEEETEKVSWKLKDSEQKRNEAWPHIRHILALFENSNTRMKKN